MTTPKRFLCLLVSCTIVIISCQKEDDYEPLPQLPTSAIAPTARAGADTTITLLACSHKVKSLILDGSKSSDPENDIDYFEWRKIVGPGGDTLQFASSAQAKVWNLSTGYYKYELLVMDKGRRTARDTIGITVIAPVHAYDLDLVFKTTFSFHNNIEVCGDWDYEPCPFYDVTEIKGYVFDNQLEGVNLFIGEYADSAALSDSVTMMNISLDAGGGLYLSGSGSVNLKKLIRQGGGAFTDRFTVMYASAQVCDSNVIKNMAPLDMTGNLNPSTKAVTIRIKGKAYF